MSAKGGHLRWGSGSLDTILKIYYLRTIHAMFALNWFTRRLLNIFYIGSNVKSSHGGHLEFPISAKNINLVYDHPMDISAKFGSNLFCGFRKKDENVKFP